jgi:hypothetical protein
MKLKHLGLGMLLVAGLAASANAALLAYEGFDYPIGGEVVGLNGGTGWTGPWTENIATSNGDFPLAADSLVNTPFPFTPTGGRLRTVGVASLGFDAVSRTMPGLDMSAEGTRYFSFLMRKEIAASSNNNLEFNLIDSTNASMNDFRFGATSADRFFLTSTDNNDLGATVATNTTYFVVMKVDANTDATADVVNVAIYSGATNVPLTEPDSWDLTFSIASNANLDGIRVRVGNSTAGSFDEFRVGETWADVATVPEPSSAILSSVSLILSSSCMRRVRNAKRAA